jgi:hypothetical protein
MPISRALPNVVQKNLSLPEVVAFFESAATSPETYGIHDVDWILDKIEVVRLRFQHVFDEPTNEEAHDYRDRLQSARERLDAWLRAAPAS